MIKLDNNEMIIYDGFLTNEKNKIVKFILTSKRISLLRKKGLFKKEYKVYKEILIDNIIVYKGEAQVKQKNSSIILHTTDKKYIFRLANIMDALKFKNELIKLRTGANFIKRSSNKARKTLGKVTAALGVGALLAKGTYDALKNSTELKNNVKNIFNLIRR